MNFRRQMQYLASLIILSFHISVVAASESVISVSSNIEDKTVFLYTQELGTGVHPRLLSLNLETKKPKTYSLDKELKDLEIMALYQTGGTLFVVAQWTKEEGKAPLIFTLNLKTNSWTKLGSIECVSFNKLAFEKNQVKLNCEEINKSGPGYTYTLKGLSTKFNFPKPSQFDLPLKEHESLNFKFQLEGTPTQWSEIKIFEKSKNIWKNPTIISATELK